MPKQIKFHTLFHLITSKETPSVREGRNWRSFKYFKYRLNIVEPFKKTILLNFLPLTSKKQNILDTFLAEYLRVLNLTLKQLPNAKSSTELHHLTYSDIRKTSFLPSDIVEEARKDVWAKRKTIKERFTRCSVRLNKRWFKFFTPRKQFVSPIHMDGGYERFKDFLEDGWEIKSLSA
ncbi:hypothetical protein IPdc08_00983 [archaeon]|nr:hypothetical protein IPdc08_00983 [archaeon]